MLFSDDKKRFLYLDKPQINVKVRNQSEIDQWIIYCPSQIFSRLCFFFSRDRRSFSAFHWNESRSKSKNIQSFQTQFNYFLSCAKIFAYPMKRLVKNESTATRLYSITSNWTRLFDPSFCFIFVFINLRFFCHWCW